MAHFDKEVLRLSEQHDLMLLTALVPICSCMMP